MTMTDSTYDALVKWAEERGLDPEDEAVVEEFEAEAEEDRWAGAILNEEWDSAYGD